ncbi:glycosyltransferase family 4 protein [Halosquirtibacter laminarini]|uniref:Glycosyltransferase family 4 protein n=1 Tax=Halosquirtibacter laminarini TaxID=3374600 RepID=A0AC61NBP7_9BACT|nr:glycosyltransferase family 4 protein [Prolixibacteraceae bacterium]
MDPNLTPPVVVCSLYYKPFVGGVESSLYYISQALKSMDEKVVIWTSDRTPSGKRAKSGFEDGVQIKRFYHPPIWFSIFTPICLILSLLRALYKDHFDRNQEVICRNHIMAVGFLLYGVRKVVYVVPSLASQIDTEVSSVASLKERFRAYIVRFGMISQHIIIQNIAIKKVPQLVVFSDTMFRQVIKVASNHKVSMLLPGVDHARYHRSLNIRKSLRSSLFLDPNFVFLCMGRMVPQKQYHDVVEAVSLLPELIKHKIKILIVGSGPEKAALIRLIQDKEVNNCFEICEATDKPEMFYAASDCFLMTSRFEPFGQTVTESLASSLPVIAYKSEMSASSEIVEDGLTGLLCPMNPSDLAACMTRIVMMKESDYNTMQKRCVVATNRYSWHEFSKSVLALLRKDSIQV